MIKHYSKLYNKEEQLFKLDRHVQLFNIDKDNLIYKLFRDLILELEAVQVECSIKFVNGKLSPDRINLILDTSFLHDNLKILFKYMSKFKEFGYNFEELDKFNFFEDENFIKKIRSIAFGLDLRTNPEETRIKFWLCGNNYNFSLFNYAYSKIMDKSKIDNLLIKNETIMGYDFYSNGLNKLKIYPHFEHQELKNDRIRKIIRNEFSSKINELIDEAHMCYISFDENFMERYIHITPHQLERILDKIDFEELKTTMVKLKDIYTKCIITFVESELNENKLKTFNFYY